MQKSAWYGEKMVIGSVTAVECKQHLTLAKLHKNTLHKQIFHAVSFEIQRNATIDIHMCDKYKKKLYFNVCCHN